MDESSEMKEGMKAAAFHGGGKTGIKWGGFVFFQVY
jgi:hypothetical protein